MGPLPMGCLALALLCDLHQKGSGGPAKLLLRTCPHLKRRQHGGPLFQIGGWHAHSQIQKEIAVEAGASGGSRCQFKFVQEPGRAFAQAFLASAARLLASSVAMLS